MNRKTNLLLILLILLPVILTGCASPQYAQVVGQYTLVYARDGAAVAVVEGGEYIAPNPLMDGCYKLDPPGFGEVYGQMEWVAPFCK